MRKLIARRSVLYLGQIYARGDRLPANNPSMVDAWLAAGSAEWLEDKPLENTLPEIKIPDSDNKTPDFNNESGGFDNGTLDFDNESGDSGSGAAESENEGTEQESAAPATGEAPASDAAPTMNAAAVAKLAKLTVPELREKATAMGIDSSRAKCKEQLINLLAAGEVK